MGDRREPLDDLELVAALIDGRLQGGERDEALARVAADPALYEVFVQARQFDTEGDVPMPAGAGAGTSGLSEPTRPARWRGWMPMAAAALILLAAGLRMTGFIGAPGGVPESVAGVAESIAPTGAALPEEWLAHDWAVSRGSGGATPISEARASARAGVLLVDLAVAWDRGDAPGLQSVAAGLLRQARLLPLGSLAEEPLAPFLDGGAIVCVPAPCPDAERHMATSRVEEAVTAAAEPGALSLGRWAEAVRLAALGGEHRVVAAWLAAPPEGWRRALEQLGIDPGDAPGPLGALAASAGSDPLDLDAVARAAGELIARF